MDRAKDDGRAKVSAGSTLPNSPLLGSSIGQAGRGNKFSWKYYSAASPSRAVCMTESVALASRGPDWNNRRKYKGA
jgi:hypothetical protein